MNAAQQLRKALGIEGADFNTAAYRQRNASATKSGPGRRHVQGLKRGKADRSPSGEFAGTHTNPQANARRAVKEAIGARQYRKQRKALAAHARATA